MGIIAHMNPINAIFTNKYLLILIQLNTPL